MLLLTVLNRGRLIVYTHPTIVHNTQANDHSFQFQFIRCAHKSRDQSEYLIPPIFMPIIQLIQDRYQDTAHFILLYHSKCL